MATLKAKATALLAFYIPLQYALIVNGKFGWLVVMGFTAL